MPTALAAFPAAVIASFRPLCRSKLPLQAPADCSASCADDGRKHKVFSSQVSLPRACECRCTTGLRPPDIKMQSQSICKASPVISVPSAVNGLTSTRATFRWPCAAVIPWPDKTSIPRLSAWRLNAGAVEGRVSTIALTRQPASCKAKAMCQVASLLVMTMPRLPGRTPYSPR